MDHKDFSRKGGQAKSERKTKAARLNAQKPRPRVKKVEPECDCGVRVKVFGEACGDCNVALYGRA